MDENDEAIRRRAHQRWESEGRPDGRHEDYWRQAQSELGTAHAAEPAKNKGSKRGAMAPSADQDRGSLSILSIMTSFQECLRRFFHSILAAARPVQTSCRGAAAWAP